MAQKVTWHLRHCEENGCPNLIFYATGRGGRRRQFCIECGEKRIEASKQATWSRRKKCCGCGRQFVPKTPTQTYCSKQHVRDAAAVRAKAQSVERRSLPAMSQAEIEKRYPSVVSLDWQTTFIDDPEILGTLLHDVAKEREADSRKAKGEILPSGARPAASREAVRALLAQLEKEHK